LEQAFTVWTNIPKIQSFALTLGLFPLFTACKPSQKAPKNANAEVLGLPKEYYRYKYPKTRTLYVNGFALGRCLGQELKKEKFTWGVNRNKYSPLFFDSYLSGSQSSYFTTPAEMPLKNWVVAQPDNSITPITLFRQSLALNNRNVFDSLVNIHTVLRNVARWNAPYVRAQKAPSTPKNIAEVNSFFNKFIDIRGDLMERGGNFRGDHPGSWYRIWGMQLKFLIDSPMGKEQVTYQNPWFNFHRDFLRVVVAGFAENIKFILPGFADDPDKARKGDLNARAANTVYWLTMTALNHPETLKTQDCSTTNYLLTYATTDTRQ
jgi:hypothetical protein